MKFIRNILTILLVVGMVGACGIDDKLDNPNQISPDQGSLNDLYNGVQLNFAQMFQSAQITPGTTTRMYMQVAFLYESLAGASTFNGLWGLAYNDLFPDVDAIIALSEGKGFDIHVGTAMIMKAYTLMVLVDLIGDVPFTEAGQGTDIISPNPDQGTDVYAAAITMLDDAIALLSGTSAGAPAADNFYDGDPDKWITAAKTMKLRAALNMGDATMFNSIINGGDYIQSTSDDFEFQAGTSRTNPSSRHPMYYTHYESGDGSYLSNYFMWLLSSEKRDANDVVFKDPRLRYYFYRKVSDGRSPAQDQTTFSCHFSAIPDYVSPLNSGSRPTYYAAVDINMPYCVLENGYSGRDHMNGEGIPPDGPIRTSYGLYPFGGDFDDDSYEDTRTGGIKGGLGEGILPIMLASWVDFMRAEADLRFGSGTSALVHMQNGINASLNKVESFETLVSAKMGTDVPKKDGTPSGNDVKEVFGMSATSKADYVTKLTDLYNAASGVQEQLAITTKEFYIAAWGNGLEAYNMYRRTGYPDNMQPALEPAPGPFPLSFFYPLNSETRNSNIDQKPNLTVPVFWQDAGVAGSLY